MTNFEYIKTMDEHEFANFMYNTNLDQCECPARSICHKYMSCHNAFVAWLQKEYVKEEK